MTPPIHNRIRERLHAVEPDAAGLERFDEVPIVADDGGVAVRDERLPPPPPPEHKLTELGNAERLAYLRGHLLRYVKSCREWRVWDGRRWCRDEVGAETLAGKAVVRSLYDEASAFAKLAAGGDEKAGDKVSELVAWANRSATEHSIRAMCVLAQSETPIAATADTFDQDPMAFNVLNGTIDLRTGDLRPHRQADMITQLAPVHFDPLAQCPMWVAFLARVQPDPAVREWLQKFIGYCLSGAVSAQILAFLLGVGANGKSTFLGVLQNILGDYAIQGPPGLLIAAERGGDDQGKRQRAALVGRRMVLCQEFEAGRYLNEAQVKAITGGDKITKARLYENETEFTPTHKLIVAANHKPHIRGQDHGIWRRIRLVPFPVTIPESERDPDLTAKLMSEAPGILAWAVRGCLAWQREGLEAPASITAATSAYQEDEDRIGDFLEVHTVRDTAGAVATAELHRLYTSWCEARSERVWSVKALASAIEERGFRLDRVRIAGVQVRGVIGLRLRAVGE